MHQLTWVIKNKYTKSEYPSGIMISADGAWLDEGQDFRSYTNRRLRISGIGCEYGDRVGEKGSYGTPYSF